MNRNGSGVGVKYTNGRNLFFEKRGMRMRDYKVKRDKFSPIEEITFTEPNGLGETITIELRKRINSGVGNTFPTLWDVHESMDEGLHDYWMVKTYVTDQDGTHQGKYNPQVTDDGKIDFAWVFAATEENRERLLEEIDRRVYAREYALATMENDISKTDRSVTVDSLKKRETAAANNTIYINGKYGVKIGNIQVFTKARAVEVFKLFAERCYNDLTMESSAVLSAVAEDMHKIGFTYEQLEEIEINTIQNGSERGTPEAAQETRNERVRSRRGR